MPETMTSGPAPIGAPRADGDQMLTGAPLPAEGSSLAEGHHLAEGSSLAEGHLLAEGTLGHMPAYGTAHLSMLALLVIAAVLLVRWARRGQRGQVEQAQVERTQVERALGIAGWVLLANSVFWTVWGFMPWAWNLEESLPLHYSDALRFLLPIALITRTPWAIVVSWFWGLTLNMQSVLTPDVNYFVWIPLEFVEYWIAHLSGVLGPVVLVWGLRIHPTWRGYGVAYAATVGWAAIAVTGNALTGANYGYLNRAPDGTSILDLLGPWPQYLLVEAVLIAVVWALMTLPWELLDRRNGLAAVGRFGLVRRPQSSQPSSSTSASRSGPSEPVITRR